MKKVILGISILAFGSSMAMAADMAVKARPMAPPVPIYVWNGWYAGVNVGYGWGTEEHSTETVLTGTAFPTAGGVVAGQPLYGSPNSFRSRAEGVLGGGQIGYNYQISPNGVIGFEADIQGADIKAHNNCILGCGAPVTLFPLTGQDRAFGVVFGADSFKSKIDWFGTVRARAGYAAGPVLLYVTGGLAYGDVSTTGSVAGATVRISNGNVLNTFAGGSSGSNFGSDSNDKTKVGWTAGFGAEGKLSWNPAWSIKGEFLYIDLGNSNDVFSTFFTSGNPSSGQAALRTLHTENREALFRLGLNYSFNSPIVAKY
jgi:outer membrane immunogenic protein